MTKFPISHSSLILAVFVTMGLTYSDYLRNWDIFIYDWAVRLTKHTVHPDIVLVEIDEKSIRQLGRWPWSRRLHARLLDRLTSVKVNAVGMDILFAEAEQGDSQGDRLLARAIARNGRVVLPLAPELQPNTTQQKFIPPLLEFAQAAASVGHTEIRLDEDNVVRSVFLWQMEDGYPWPYFAQAVWQTGNKSINFPHAAGHDVEHWQRSEPVAIPFINSLSKLQRISYVDALSDDRFLNRLEGRWVLIGMTASGLGQRFPTPVTVNTNPMSGLELHGQVLNALLNNLSINKLNHPSQLLLSCLLVVLASRTQSIQMPWIGLLGSVAVLICTVVSAYILMNRVSIWFSPASSLAGQLFLHALWTARRLEFADLYLAREKKNTATILKSVGDGVVATDADGYIRFMNPVAERLTGYSFEEVRGKTLNEVVNLVDGYETSARFYDLHGNCNADISSGIEQKPLFLINRHGAQIAVRITMNIMLNDRGVREGYVLAISDISETLQISRQMTHLATHDTLTGLPNRVLFSDRLNKVLAQARRDRSGAAIFFMDLDHFKKINDSLGHDAGDELLKHIALRLQSCIRSVDSAARWGGDEFVVILANVHHSQSAAEVAEKIRLACSEPFVIQDKLLYISFSIGISLFPQDAEQEENLMRYADTAMYRVKALGRNRYGFYSPEIEKWTAERLALEADLHQAIAKQEFEVFYQPQWDLWGKRLVGLEALLRWRHEEKGFISPDQFIGLAEETGLIIPIGEWVIADVCRQVRAWSDDGFTGFTVSVNLSPRQFLQTNIAESITQLLIEHKIPEGVIKLEITESVLTDDIDTVIDILTRIRSQGVSIAIDDFGTGYSSLNLLRNLPIDQLKVDKCFVKNVATDSGDAAIAKAIITLANNLELSVVIEGVETATQLAFFQNFACDGIQGYYFNKPLTVDEVNSLLADLENGEQK
ncbi:EAL domain-containing protein [Methylotuvimicrobium sp. KM2]|uniref:EAL domain-containing protein n=1 Tax=Methylotuvimicrobium sp. KM2 TaxID=3133976 RepID=UPI0031010842